MDLVEELLGLARALSRDRVEYAVCGGIALAIHGHPRFTKDIDLLIQAEDLERVRVVAEACGFVLQGLPMHFGAGSASEREIHRLTKVAGSETLTLDLLLAGPALAGAWRSRLRAEWRGTPLWVVSREGLLLMKRLSGRAQDLADIQALDGPEPGSPDG